MAIDIVHDIVIVIVYVYSLRVWRRRLIYASNNNAYTFAIRKTMRPEMELEFLFLCRWSICVYLCVFADGVRLCPLLIRLDNFVPLRQTNRGSNWMSSVPQSAQINSNSPTYTCKMRPPQSNVQTKMDLFLDGSSMWFLPSFCTRAKFTYAFISFLSFCLLPLLCGWCRLHCSMLLGYRLWLIGPMNGIKAIYFDCVHVCDSRLRSIVFHSISGANIFFSLLLFLFSGDFFPVPILNVTARANRLMPIITREIKFRSVRHGH